MQSAQDAMKMLTGEHEGSDGGNGAKAISGEHVPDEAKNNGGG